MNLAHEQTDSEYEYGTQQFAPFYIVQFFTPSHSCLSRSEQTVKKKCVIQMCEMCESQLNWSSSSSSEERRIL